MFGVRRPSGLFVLKLSCATVCGLEGQKRRFQGLVFELGSEAFYRGPGAGVRPVALLKLNCEPVCDLEESERGGPFIVKLSKCMSYTWHRLGAITGAFF